MNLKTLLIAVLALAVLAGVVAFFSRPAALPETDPRVGAALLPRELAAAATALTLRQDEREVRLRRQPDGGWVVASYHDLPADFTKLTRFIGDLTATTLDRFVTAHPERLARLELGQVELELATTAYDQPWSVRLGRSAEGGGRFLAFGDEDRAYLARLNAWIDPQTRSWADSALLDLSPGDIARVELTFPDAAPFIAQRGAPTETFTVPPPLTRPVRATALTTLLTTLTNLRFIDTTAPADPEVLAAREQARTITLTTFAGETLTLALGRRPAITREVLGEPAADSELDDPTPTTDPAGPVYVFITRSDPTAWINAYADRLAFKLSDHPYTSLPASAEALLEPAPTEN
jgi:hypothetical protein